MKYGAKVIKRPEELKPEYEIQSHEFQTYDKPTIVVEVAYEEIQRSPTYTSGYALRFPRLVRIRSDKGVEDIDTLERIESLLRN